MTSRRQRSTNHHDAGPRQPHAELYLPEACAGRDQDVCRESGCAFGEEAGADYGGDEDRVGGWEDCVYLRAWEGGGGRAGSVGGEK